MALFGHLRRNRAPRLIWDGSTQMINASDARLLAWLAKLPPRCSASLRGRVGG
jgi:hypothetical protein